LDNKARGGNLSIPRLEIKEKIMNRRILVATLLALVFVTSTLSVSAQHGYRVTKRLAFKKGEVATVVKGAIPNTLEGHEYVVRARQGQTMSLKLITAKKGLGFSVWAPNGDLIAEETAQRQWSGELPETGDYRIVLNTETEGVATYTLRVQIATDI
jgi:hypothetical protein